MDTQSTIQLTPTLYNLRNHNVFSEEVVREAEYLSSYSTTEIALSLAFGTISKEAAFLLSLVNKLNFQTQ